MTQDLKARRIMVSGRVQGVFFRKYTEARAQKLGLVGTVENLPDGRVMIVAEGDEAPLDELVQWCYEGSPASAVDSVDVEIIKSTGYTGFSIKR